MSETLLLTGATGYIGSHTWVALLQAGYRVIGLDNLSNSRLAVVDRVARISGREPEFIKGDVRDRAHLKLIFDTHSFDGVIHFAALKSVGDSIARPIEYYDNNLGGLVAVCEAMQRTAVRNLVFSSSANVYGRPDCVPVTEDFPLAPNNPYGETKLAGETLLRKLSLADPAWNIACLRYFNPVGAHPSGLIGEDPQDVPNNLMPYVAQVAAGRRESVSVFGADYPTPDGTGIRDYIHVCDLADGHVAAWRHLASQAGGFTVNLGTGRGYSVLEVIAAYARASGRDVPYHVAGRRDGDVAESFADPRRATHLLGWHAIHDLDRMCIDSWRWQSMNPNGLADADSGMLPLE